MLSLNRIVTVMIRYTLLSLTYIRKKYINRIPLWLNVYFVTLFERIIQMGALRNVMIDSRLLSAH